MISFDKYLTEPFLTCFYETYEEDYLKSLDEENFLKVYNLFKNINCYFIEDIILNYLEIFSLDVNCLEESLENLKHKLGDNYISQIGKDMTILDEVINMAIEYEKELNT